MMHRDKITFETSHEMDIVDITKDVEKVLTDSAILEGIINLFCTGSTGAITTIEYEPGLVRDFPRSLDFIAPKNMQYDHDERWHDGNGRSHIKASLVGPELNIPVENGKLVLGTWQQIVFIECDTRPRDRTVVVTIME